MQPLLAILFLSLSFFTTPGATDPLKVSTFNDPVKAITKYTPGYTGYLNCHDGILCKAGGPIIDPNAPDANGLKKVTCTMLKKKAIKFAKTKEDKKKVEKYFFTWNRHLMCAEENILTAENTNLKVHPHTYCWDGQKHSKEKWDEEQRELCDAVFAKNKKENKDDTKKDSKKKDD